MMKKKMEALQNYQSKSVVISSHLTSLDVFSILKEDDTAYINYLMVQNGTIIQTHTLKVEAKIEEQEEDILCQTIFHLRQMFNSSSTEIILPYVIDYPDELIKITVPKLGDKKKLLDLSLKNVNYYKEELRKKKILRLEGKSDIEKLKVLYELKENLQLSEVPRHIECFDNSNFQGSYPVSAMVCFKEGEPSKKDYRHFNVKTVEGINDFATMKEAVYRRYKRLKEEEQPLPQLIIIDGGKGQLGSAVEALNELGMMGLMNIVGLAKNEEEIFFPGDSQSVKLPYDGDGLKFIRRVRDEVHRFGITFHRNQRSKGTFKNELEEINGIGENTATELLKAFKSVKNIRTQTLDALAKIIGKSKAKIVLEHYHSGL
jgi:excinuclease ABC subunit C